MTTIERFREKFPNKMQEVVDDFGSTLKPDIEAFILSELTSQKERIVGELEGMKKEESNLAGMAQLDLTYERHRAFNAGIQAAQDYIRKV